VVALEKENASDMDTMEMAEQTMLLQQLLLLNCTSMGTALHVDGDFLVER